MIRLTLILVFFSTALFSQNTNVNTNVKVMGMEIMDVNVQETKTSSESTPTQNTNVTNNDQKNKCTLPVSSSEFEKMTSSIKAQSFEETQLKIAKQALKSNCLSSSQIKGICKLFSFEESKLDFAIFAYKYCTDKNNYYTINDIFTFSSSVDSLNDAIEKQQ
jgi:hypothetical protein